MGEDNLAEGIAKSPAAATSEGRVYPDGDVCLRVGGDAMYRVSSYRLSRRSGIFKTMFELPKSRADEGLEVIDLPELAVDAFEDYLWYIYADPLEANEYASRSPSVGKCTRYLGIATVAHAYDSLDVARWAAHKALAMLAIPSRMFFIDKKILDSLVSIVSRWQDQEAEAIVRRCKDVLCDALHPTRKESIGADPIAFLSEAKWLDDKEILAHTYFYVHSKGEEYWKTDGRLEPVDRRRLLCGSHSLLSKKLQAKASEPAPTGRRYTSYLPDISATVFPLVHADIGARDKLWNVFNDAEWKLV